MRNKLIPLAPDLHRVIDLHPEYVTINTASEQSKADLLLHRHFPWCCRTAITGIACVQGYDSLRSRDK